MRKRSQTAIDSSRPERHRKASAHGRVWAKASIAALAIILLFPTAAFAGSMSDADFSDPTVTTFDGLGLPFFNESPLVIDGNTYDTDSQMVRYWSGPLGGDCYANDCISTHGDTDSMEVVLSQPARRAGVWVGVSAATVDFYDETDSLLGSVDVTPVLGQYMEFAGWEADVGLIRRLRITDTEANTHVVVIDNLMVENGIVPTSTPVTIDIRPGSDQNPINLSSRTVPVAILTTETFDATRVNPATVMLAGAKARAKGNGGSSSSLTDVDGDGDIDLLLRIAARQMKLAPGDVEATLTGSTFGGIEIEGTDYIRIVP